jgi:hypothetical protein
LVIAQPPEARLIVLVRPCSIDPMIEHLKVAVLHVGKQVQVNLARA